MKRKRALIVDDSKTARQFLTSKLSHYEIDVDTRESAASAIDYLYTNTPDAVFLDFEMPGMDGFQALKIIKSNPNTATIPVMMYTSRSGGIELSQARALGAVGVLPKQLEPQNLDAVIRQLHLMPDQQSLVKKFHHQADKFAAVPHPPAGQKIEYLHKPEETEDTIQYPAENYDESVFVLKRQTRIFQKELLNAEKRVMDRLSDGISQLKTQIEQMGASLLEKKSGSSWILNSLLLINMLVLIAVGYFLWQQNSPGYLHELLDRQGQVMQQGLSDIQDLIADLDQRHGVTSSQSLESSAETKSVSVELLEWAANRGTAFEYGVNPFDDVRALWLSDLVKQMRAVGFLGVISLKANYGNFCLKKSETGVLVLAGDQDPFEECLFSNATTEKGFAQSSYQTIGFANYLNTLLSEESIPIEVFVDSDEYGEPVVPYPESYTVKTAGEWNSIARQNQRILVSVFPRQSL